MSFNENEYINIIQTCAYVHVYFSTQVNYSQNKRANKKLLLYKAGARKYFVEYTGIFGRTLDVSRE